MSSITVDNICREYSIGAYRATILWSLSDTNYTLTDLYVNIFYRDGTSLTHKSILPNPTSPLQVETLYHIPNYSDDTYVYSPDIYALMGGSGILYFVPYGKSLYSIWIVRWDGITIRSFTNIAVPTRPYTFL